MLQILYQPPVSATQGICNGAELFINQRIICVLGCVADAFYIFNARRITHHNEMLKQYKNEQYQYIVIAHIQ